jgi:hypothetical protein
MSKLHIRYTYRNFVSVLGKRHRKDEAMRLAVGGEFEAIGIVERAILVQYGSHPEHLTRNGALAPESGAPRQAIPAPSIEIFARSPPVPPRLAPFKNSD